MVQITSIADSLNQRLGSDTLFPISGEFQPVSGVPLLLQDIQQLLLTIPGERLNRPEFGCGLMGQIWENMDTIVINGPAIIRTAIESFEPRITLLNVDATPNENTGLVVFNIQFQINSTDNILNLVFPFRQGTQLSFS